MLEKFIRFTDNNSQVRRKVLNQYSEKLLDQFISITATLSIITYSLYSILNNIPTHLIYTTPFVIYGIFRALYILYVKNRGTDPEQEMLRDPHLLLAVLWWGITSVVIITYYQ